MYIYNKAYPFLFRLALILIILNTIFLLTKYQGKADIFVPVVSIIFYVFISLFFRVPVRKSVENNNYILAPADGLIVALEEIFEDEYLKTACIKISIFMSVFNVHQNIIPVSGEIKYLKHHPGKHIVAWHPKSSFKNEHTSIIIEIDGNVQIKVSQIAGIIAKRIVCNFREGDEVRQGDELGFIFFGSRVDIYLPLWARIKVKPGDKVKAKFDIIAEVNNNNG
ncbi:MAG: phosphatidylserine decarboxylase family protein [Bacteroidales bacterium]|nr:phosphatidylserine decarboxylase family protein [Bacteroidales bacterium]